MTEPLDGGPADDALAIPSELLAIDPDDMRRLGYWVVDRTIDHLTTLRDQPAVSESDPATLEEILGGPPPRRPGNIDHDLRLLADVAATNQQHGGHPRYFARVPGPASFPSVLGDWLATGMQAVASSWGGGSGPSALEVISLRWLSESIGLPAGTEGVMQSGGSLANLTGIVAARHQCGDGVIYLSDQTHASLVRSLPAIGQPAPLVRRLTTDAEFRLSPIDLRTALEADLARGLRPMMVIATAGTTNTGAVDDLPAIADLCNEFELWLHVDGAYGGPAALTERGREQLRGIERADSFALDPHKWLFQAYDLACLFVTHPGVLESTFAMYPEYLADAAGRSVDLHNRSFELTRRGRAFKLWLTLRTYGIDTLAHAIDRGIALAEYAQAVIDDHPQLEIVTPAQLGIVTFTDSRVDGAAHVRAAAELTLDGYAAVTSTVLNGRTVLRLCVINPATTTADLDGTISRLADILKSP